MKLNPIKTCDCNQCRHCRMKRKAFKEANRKFRRQGKKNPEDVGPVSTGYIG